MAWWEDEKIRKWVLIVTLIVLVVLVGVVLVILTFAINFPISASVDDATLSQFSLSTSTSPPSLSYSLSVLLDLHNPNWWKSVSFTALSAEFSYAGAPFDSRAAVPAFVLDGRKTNLLRLSVNGTAKAVGLLGDAGVKQFGNENKTGVFTVEARLNGAATYRLRRASCPVAIVCGVQLQLAEVRFGSAVFQKTKCNVLRSGISC